jgi:cob(I)alamin adenosyltransferase
MGYRLSKISTKTGDDGTTQVEAGKRLAKDAPRINALGDLDELNSALGIVLAYPIQDHAISAILQQVQQDLFNLGGELCPPHRPAITETTTLLLEQAIVQWNDTLPPLTEFILPGGNLIAAHCHLARTICRRAERSLVHLHHSEPLQPEILRYINRLSDLLFIFARVFARQTTSTEILWNHTKQK